jgi:hypothetical protein
MRKIKMYVFAPLLAILMIFTGCVTTNSPITPPIDPSQFVGRYVFEYEYGRGEFIRQGWGFQWSNISILTFYTNTDPSVNANPNTMSIQNVRIVPDGGMEGPWGIWIPGGTLFLGGSQIRHPYIVNPNGGYIIDWVNNDWLTGLADWGNASAFTGELNWIDEDTFTTTFYWESVYPGASNQTFGVVGENPRLTETFRRHPNFHGVEDDGSEFSWVEYWYYSSYEHNSIEKIAFELHEDKTISFDIYAHIFLQETFIVPDYKWRVDNLGRVVLYHMQNENQIINQQEPNIYLDFIDGNLQFNLGDLGTDINNLPGGLITRFWSAIMGYRDRTENTMVNSITVVRDNN